MIAGILMQSFTMIYHLGMTLYPAFNGSSAASSFFDISFVISSLGGFMFSGGFALTAWQLSQLRERTAELEMMNLAQAAELERLRNR
jgi:hypothetical protein